MFRVFQGETADDVFRKISSALVHAPKGATQPSRLGPTKEILHACLTINDPRQRWIATRRSRSASRRAG